MRLALGLTLALGSAAAALALPDINVVDPDGDPYVRVNGFHLLPLLAFSVGFIVVALSAFVFLRSDLARRFLSATLFATAWLCIAVVVLTGVIYFLPGFVPVDALIHVFVPPVVLYGGLSTFALWVRWVLRQPSVVAFTRRASGTA